jgi:hypothetical protein
MTKKRLTQSSMFNSGEDSPLLSNSPMRANDETFTPAETPTQTPLFAATFDGLASAKQAKRQRKAKRKAAGSLRGLTFGDDIKSTSDALPLWLVPDDNKTAKTSTQWLESENGETPTPTAEKRPTPHASGRHMLVVPGEGGRRHLTAFQVMIAECAMAGTADWRYTTLVIDNDHNRRLHDADDIKQGLYFTYYHGELTPITPLVVGLVCEVVKASREDIVTGYKVQIRSGQWREDGHTYNCLILKSELEREAGSMDQYFNYYHDELRPVNA